MFAGLVQRSIFCAPPVAVVGGGSATPFNSLGISTFGWWTADDPSTVNTGSSNVWTAKSGSAGPLTQATSTKRGTYTSGVKLSFDSDDELNLASGPTTYDAVAVITANSSNATWRTLLWAQANMHPAMLESGSNRLGAYNGGFSDSGYTIAPSVMALVHCRMDSGGGCSIALNGNSLVGVASYGSGQAIAVVGNASAGAQPIGDIHAIAISGSGPWSSGDLDKAVGCLAWEWGLQGSLPVGHPYKSAAP